MDIKNIVKNITPSVTVMVVGLVGAYFVYNTYFSERVASGLSGITPAAGEEAVLEQAADSVEDVEGIAAIDTIEGAVETVIEETVTTTEETVTETVTETTTETVTETVTEEATEEATGAIGEAVEDAAEKVIDATGAAH